MTENILTAVKIPSVSSSPE